MYKIYADGEIFCKSDAEELALVDPVVSLEANKAGSFTFKMLPSHPWYNKLIFRQTMIDVYVDGDLIFEGIPVSESVDFWRQKKIVCEGELTFLNDTIQRPAKYTSKTPQTLLSAYLAVHNAQADSDKQFTLGSVTVNGSGLYRFTNFQTTMQEIGEDLVDDLGGYLRVRHSGGVRYLDYLASSPRTSSQIIKLGKNLMDLVKDTSAEEICTVLIPQGAKTGTQTVQGIDDRVDIKSVNNGLDYITSSAVSTYGKVWKTVVWDDVTVPANLLSKAQAYMNDVQWTHTVIEATAFDLGLADESVQQLRLLDNIRVVSEPHNLDRYFMLTKLDLNLNEPGETQITLGEELVQSLSAQSAQVSEIVMGDGSGNILDQAQANARAILESATHGNIRFQYDSTGVIYEILIMDTADPATATKIWRWNINGWGYSGDGGQTYTVAATMNGAIVADLITAGTLQGIEIIAEQGSIGGWTISDKAIYKDVVIGTTTYRAYLQPPNTTSGTNTWVLSCQKKESGESTFTGIFKLRADGSAEFSGATADTAMVKVQKLTDADFNAILSPYGLTVKNTDNGYNASYYGGGFAIRDTSSGTTRVYLTPNGITFYDANGNVTKFYSAT